MKTPQEIIDILRTTYPRGYQMIHEIYMVSPIQLTNKDIDSYYKKFPELRPSPETLLSIAKEFKKTRLNTPYWYSRFGRC